jgi:energy-coupling factor transporter ATP-binding protein EcfA2
MSQASSEQIRLFIAQLREYVGGLPASGVPVNPLWEQRFRDVEERLQAEPEVSIALLGGTGAGKSTLVNALIESRLLPVSSMKACTSAVTEVAFGEGPYRGEVTFISRSAWHTELQLLTAEIADSRGEHDDSRAAEDADNGRDPSVSRAAEDKLVALYGAEVARRYLVDLDPSHLVETERIRYAFDNGVLRFEFDDEVQFRTALKRFLDSDEPYWPIVEKVRVRGPFAALSEGIVLVDLPGLNDPNAAREAATRKHLAESQFVWVVFNMKRALTRDVFDFLREGELLRRLYTEGRTDSLVLVGTASDDVDIDADIERLGLADDAAVADIVDARSREVMDVARGQLDELGRLIAQNASEAESRADDLRRQLRQAPIHCVSAREYQKCIGIMRRSNHQLTDPSATKIPALQAEARQLVGDQGRQAQLNHLLELVRLVREEIVRTLQTHQGRAQAERDATEAQLEEVKAAAAQAATFLDERTERAVERFDAAVDQAKDVLNERLRAAVQDAETKVEGIDQPWRQMHWNTMRATVRRDGQWASGGRRIDLAEQLAKPLLDSITFAWVDFFGDRALRAVENLAEGLKDSAADYIDRFQLALRPVPALAEVVEKHAEVTADAARQLVDQRLSELDRDVKERLTTDRRRLTDDVLAQIRYAMKPAFAEAVDVRGQGSGSRMVDILHHHAVRTSEEMFASVRTEVEDLLVELTTFLHTRARAVAMNVQREALSMNELVTSRASTQLDPAVHDAAAERLQELGDQAPEH